MKKYKVTVNGTNYEITLEAMDGAEASSVPSKTVSPAENVSTGGESVNSPMPGTILSIYVKAGQSVKKGDVLMILEAMKMENEIMCPCDGTVSSIQVAKGASVESGTVLCTIA